jgi:hypothetical protein
LEPEKPFGATYFLTGPAEGAKAPKEGHGLIVVLPGGDGPVCAIGG